MVTGKPCRDCEPGSKRPAPHPGPRCVSHHRAVVKARRLAAQEKRVHGTYGIGPDKYNAIYEVQGGRCAICERATGARRRLAVDHDHAQAVLDGHEPDKGCPNCVRGLLCSTCNKTHGHLRDSPEAWDRGAEYLRNWPSRRAAIGPTGEPSSPWPSRSAGIAGATATRQPNPTSTTSSSSMTA